MKSTLCILLFSALAPFLRADQLRDAPINEIVTQALPTLKYVSGDKGWNGGYYTNAYIGNVEFDANTCFTVFRTADASLSATDIAVRVRSFIIKRFVFPVTKPSSAWEKKDPENISRSDFGEAFLVTFPLKNNQEDKGFYISVQVVRRTSTDFGITTQYSTVAKP